MILLNSTNFKNINYEKFNKIKQNGIKEYKIYYEKIQHRSCLHLSKKTFDKMGIPESKRKDFFINEGQVSLVTSAISISISSTKYNLNNSIEKLLFVINTIFPNDEKFLNYLQNSNNIEIINELISNYTYFDKYEEKEERIKRQLFLKSFFNKNQEELKNIVLYFQKFHNVNDLEIILNRALQIYYTNNELYNNYINNIETKKLTKK